MISEEHAEAAVALVLCETNHTEVPVKALAISLVTGVALCGIMSAPASALPTNNLAAAANDLALGQSVSYVCGKYRCWWRPD